MYGKEKEIEGIKNTLILLIDKQNYFQQELTKQADVEVKNSLQTKLKDLDKEIAEYRQKLTILEPSHTILTTNMSKKVFISYNHNDKDAARHLKNALVAAGIEVTIDSEAMAAGSKISDFIRKSIQDTQVTVSIISEKSLLSAWVAMESILTLHNQKQFIACYITDKFFQNEFVESCEDEIDKQVNKLKTEVTERLAKDRGIEHITDELTRQKDLKHNLSKFIGELRSRLCIDIAGYNFLDNVPKVIKAIKG
jgi:hypothetical protein